MGMCTEPVNPFLVGFLASGISFVSMYLMLPKFRIFFRGKIAKKEQII